MEAISKDQIKAIYALGGSLGLVEHGSHEDNLHLLVESTAGKSSVSSLTGDEAAQVLAELKHRMRFCNQEPPASSGAGRHKEKPGGVTADQQRKVWALMYRLRASSPSTATLGDRLAGIIRYQLKLDATAKEPFAWMTYRDGWELIEAIKGIVKKAEKKQGGVPDD